MNAVLPQVSDWTSSLLDSTARMPCWMPPFPYHYATTTCKRVPKLSWVKSPATQAPSDFWYPKSRPLVKGWGVGAA